MKVLILGSGWYGCMIALICKSNNIEYLILDKDYIFNGSSSKNQNRLHLGYHYPRSPETIKECIEGYHLFNYLFDKYTKDIKYNIYGIEKNSKVDYKKYENIFSIKKDKIVSEQILKNIKLEINKNIIEETFICDEKRINHKKIKNKFIELFNNNFEKFDKSKLLIIDKNITYNNSKYDFFCNCTYGQSNIGFEEINLDCYYELCLSFLYKYLGSNKDISLTIMDGNYVSLFSYEDNYLNNLFSLTHVTYTPIYKNEKIENILDFQKNIDIKFINEKQDIFENDINKYLLNFNENFIYHDYYLSIKCKFNSAEKSEDRSLKYFENNNNLMFIGGKITGIFNAINIFSKKININIDYNNIKKLLQ